MPTEADPQLGCKRAQLLDDGPLGIEKIDGEDLEGLAGPLTGQWSPPTPPPYHSPSE